MKSVIAEATTISKAVEEAWKKAGCPVEFFTKIVEEPKSGFLGFGAKSAIIALFFKKDAIKKDNSQDKQLEVLGQDSYSGFFNNKNLKVEGQDNKSAKKEQSSDKKQQRPQNQQRKRNNNRNFSGQRKNNQNSQNNQNKKNTSSNSTSEKREARPQRSSQGQRPQRNRNQNQNRNKNFQNKKKSSDS